MSRVVLDERKLGSRREAGTDWPIVDQLVRDQIPGRKPTWEIVHSLCNGVPGHVSVYTTKREALTQWGEVAS